MFYHLAQCREFDWFHFN